MTAENNEKILVLSKKDVANYLAERIKITRRHLRVSLKEMSQQLGITKKQLQNYENAKSNLTVVRLWEIATILHLDPSFFIEGLSNKNSALSNEDLKLIYGFHHIRNKPVQEALVNLLTSCHI